MKRKIGLILALMMLSVVFIPAIEASAAKTGMGYLYSGTPADHVQYVDRTKGAIQTVTPNYFDIAEDGNVELTKRFSSSFIAEMKKRNVDVVPFLSNHWNRELGRKALKNREAFTTQLAQYVKQYDLDGINVDIEGLTETDRDAFTAFVKLLRSKIPASKEVSVAVAANPKGYTKGWHGSYDYNGLAKHADYLMVMSYDESWDGSAPGPVASLPFVEKSVQYALKQGVPAHKVVLGLPFYGRIWNEDQVKVGYTPAPGTQVIDGNGISLFLVNEFIKNFNGKSTYHSEYDSVKTTLEIKTPNDPRAKLNSWSKPLPVGKYEIWHETPETLKKKIQLVHKYDLKGIGSWSLGQESANVWANFDFWLSGKVFADVELEHWAAEAIANMKEKGWMGGRTSKLFVPEGSLKRSETAAVLIRALELNMESPYSSPFKDVSDTYWGRGAIEVARQHELMSGRADDKFAPEAVVTREEMAVILSRIIQVEQAPSGDNPFGDVDENRWSYQSIRAMNEAGIFGGFSDGSFRPYEPVTRAQMAALLERISRHLS